MTRVLTNEDHLGAAAAERAHLVQLDAVVERRRRADHVHAFSLPESTTPRCSVGSRGSANARQGSSIETMPTRSSSLTNGADRAAVTCSAADISEHAAMTPRSVPWSRRWRVSARVSTPRRPGIPLRCNSSSRVRSPRAMPDVRGELAHHQRAALDPVGFGGVVAAAVVADERVGHHHHLTRVGGIGDHLLVPGHAGVEDHLAVVRVLERRAEENPFVGRTGFERETAAHVRHW